MAIFIGVGISSVFAIGLDMKEIIMFKREIVVMDTLMLAQAAHPVRTPDGSKFFLGSCSVFARNEMAVDAFCICSNVRLRVVC